MSPPLFVASAVIIALVALVHSVLGERFILMRMKSVPALLGGESFTRGTLRFAWHALSFAWWAMAALLVLTPPEAEALIGWTIIAALGITSVATMIATRGRHLSWIVEWAIIGMLWAAL